MNFFVDFVIETHVAVVVNFNLYSFQMDWNSFWVTFSHICFELIFNENCCMQIFACILVLRSIIIANCLDTKQQQQSSYIRTKNDFNMATYFFLWFFLLFKKAAVSKPQICSILRAKIILWVAALLARSSIVSTIYFSSSVNEFFGKKLFCGKILFIWKLQTLIFAKNLTRPTIFFFNFSVFTFKFFLRTQLVYFFISPKMRFSKEEEKMLECRNWRAKPHLFIVRVGHHHSPSTYYFLCKSLALTEFYQKIGPIKVRGAYLITNCCRT